MSMNMHICNTINFLMKKKSKSNYVDLISVDQQNKIMCVSVNPHAVPNMNLHFLIRWHISSRKGGIMVLNHFWLRFNLIFLCIHGLREGAHVGSFEISKNWLTVLNLSSPAEPPSRAAQQILESIQKQPFL